MYQSRIDIDPTLVAALPSGDPEATATLRAALDRGEPWARGLFVGALRERQSWATRAFHVWYRPLIDRICRRRLGAEDAADCASEIETVFLARDVDRERVLETFPGYLIKTAYSRVHRWLRDSARRERILGGAGAAEVLSPRAARSAEEVAVDAQLVQRIRGCIEHLRDDQRELIEQHYRDDLTRQEIAAARGCSYQNVDMTLKRIRRALAACLGLRVEDERGG
ncbi:MAG: sigma-70 family RNA polymerase sigma factor [Deltaproteobacteria bacterium]|nr:sigma-70 family RNA polymerase sigma factor [Deltaproteobacteria bacterium]